jgi:hypothetical protein
MAMFKVKYYKEKAQALLIQRMFVWQGYGCTIQEDASVMVETGGTPSAVLYKHRTPVASGFFAAVEWFLANGLTHCTGAPPLNKDRVKSLPAAKMKKAKQVTKPKPPAKKVDKPADPFAADESTSGPTF